MSPITIRKNNWRFAVIASAALALAACAARQVTPVSMVQAGDERLSCSAINQQIRNNQAEAGNLLQQNKSVNQANAAKVVASVVLSGWIMLAVDLSNEEQIKMRALADRNESLTFLKSHKGCT